MQWLWGRVTCNYSNISNQCGQIYKPFLSGIRQCRWLETFWASYWIKQVKSEIRWYTDYEKVTKVGDLHTITWLLNWILHNIENSIVSD